MTALNQELIFRMITKYLLGGHNVLSGARVEALMFLSNGVERGMRVRPHADFWAGGRHAKCAGDFR